MTEQQTAKRLKDIDLSIQRCDKEIKDLKEKISAWQSVKTDYIIQHFTLENDLNISKPVLITSSSRSKIIRKAMIVDFQVSDYDDCIPLVRYYRKDNKTLNGGDPSKLFSYLYSDIKNID